MTGGQERTTYNILVPPLLTEFTFRREGPIRSMKDISPEIGFNLSVSRFAERVLGIALTASVGGIPNVSVSSCYRVLIEIEPGPHSRLLKEMKLVAARLAPGLLYPFLRESIYSALLKAGLPPLVPPVIDIPSLFSIDDVEIPAFDERRPEEGSSPADSTQEVTNKAVHRRLPGARR
ncbi:MAG: protein-export chaperone SecB [Acidobacteria bacterium]|nr:protein-export chaperone SecB [Acidobacteriota bacterium]